MMILKMQGDDDFKIKAFSFKRWNKSVYIYIFMNE